MLPAVRSLLFAPASDERKLRRASDSGAGALVADLEDSVPADAKVRARETLVSTFAGAPGGGGALIVRVNGVETGWTKADVEAAEAAGAAAIMLPKARVAHLARPEAGSLPVVALIESAAGLLEAGETASHPAVVGVMLGTLDLANDLVVDGASWEAMRFARGWLVMAARAAEIGLIVDGVHADVGDLEGLERAALGARELGFTAKACVHPAQVGIVDRAFRPTEAERAWATRVLSAYESALARGAGVVAVDGEMVDAPVADRARGVLARCEDGTAQ